MAENSLQILAGDWPAEFKQKQFWLDFFWISEDWPEFPTEEGAQYPGLAEYQLTFQIGTEYELTLLLNEHLCPIDLGLSQADSPEIVQVAWDDQAHWHPHLFRWKELRTICRSVAAQYPQLPHPGLPLLLLCRFSQIEPVDKIEGVRAELSKAWRSLGIFSENELADLADKITTSITFGVPDQRLWLQHPERGWLNSGDGAYSLRSEDNEEFPFPTFNRMLEEAQRLCGG